MSGRPGALTLRVSYRRRLKGSTGGRNSHDIPSMEPFRRRRYRPPFAVQASQVGSQLTANTFQERRSISIRRRMGPSSRHERDA